MTSIAAVECEVRERAIRAELAFFKSKADTLTHPLRSVCQRMALVRTRVEAGLDDAAAQADLAARLHRLDVVAGVWTTFRERLVQRCDPWMKNSLHTADELAWACLAPFGEQVDRLPLCVVASTDSARAYRPGDTLLPPGVRTSPSTLSLLGAPVALIELRQTAVRVPHHLAAIAHEAGHLLAAGSELARLGEVLDGSPDFEARQAEEVFADLFALASLGSAFLVFLAQQRAVADVAGFGLTARYPSWDLRLGLLHAVLRHLLPEAAAAVGTLGLGAPVEAPAGVLDLAERLFAQTRWDADRDGAARQGANLRTLLQRIERPLDVPEHFDARRDQVAALVHALAVEGAPHALMRHLDREPPTMRGGLGPIEREAERRPAPEPGAVAAWLATALSGSSP